MKILPIQKTDIKIKNTTSNKQEFKNFSTDPNNFDNSSIDSKAYQSYFLSFEGVNTLGKNASKGLNSLKEIESLLTPHAEQLIESAKGIARKYGYSVVSQAMIMLSGLIAVKEYITKLNTGEIDYGDNSGFFIPNAIAEETTRDVFKDKTKRKKFAPVIDEQIKVIDEYLEANKPKDTTTPKKISLDSGLISDIKSQYNLVNNEDDFTDGLLQDETIFTSALDSYSDKFQKDIVIPFRMAIKESVLIDKRPMEERIHLSFYDEKAKNIWEKLSYRTNMVILNDKETTPSHLINSLLNIFENADSNSKFNKENTEIINFNDIGTLDNFFLMKKFKEIEKNPDKNYILIMSIMDKELNSLDIDMTNEEIFNSAPENIRFIMVADKDEYLKKYQDDSLKGFFDNFSDISIPLMTVQRTKAMFKEQPKLMKKIKKPFEQDAIEKTIDLSASLKGNFPEKAQKLMNEIALSFIEKDIITIKEIDEFVRTHKEKFKQADNQSSSIKTILDTKAKLKDVVGKDSALQDAKLIVDSVLDKTLGTKGYIIYSEDGMEGAGRKFLAKAIAGELESPYIEADGIDFCTEKVDIFSMFTGGGSSSLTPEASMKKLFSIVKSQAETTPTKSAVVLFENFAVFSNEDATEYSKKALSQLGREMEEAEEQGFNIVIMGSVPSEQYLDAMTLPSSKFLETIVIDSPAYNSDIRRNLIVNELEKQKAKLTDNETEREEIITQLVRTTEFASRTDIKLLIEKAKHVAKERKHDLIEKSDITEAYLRKSVGRVSGVKEPIYRKELVTSHECAHALNAYIMEELAIKQNRPDHVGTKVNFITLDPRGNFGGAVYTSDLDNPEYSFEHVFSDIICDFGGTSAEQEFYGQNGSWGITADMQMATASATRAAAIMGQGKHFGKKSFSGMAFLSQEDQNLINKDINVILKNAEVVSGAITSVYADFNREFTKKYAPKVGTGECIIQREEFVKFLNEWREKQSPEKQKEFELLDQAILNVIKATKEGIVCYREA